MIRENIDHRVVDFESPNAGKEIYNSLKDSRFVVLRNHGVPINLIERIKNDWRPFFANKTKYSYLRTDEEDEGFIPINFETAEKEQIADFKELYQTHYEGIYPSNIDVAATKELFTSMVQLNNKICSLIDLQLPPAVKSQMPKSLFNMVEGANNHLIRVIHYPPIDDQETKASRGAAHTDISLFTAVFGLLLEGLEFKHEDGTWHTPNIDREDIVFFNSEMIELCTHGLLKALPHQVKVDPMKKSSSRYAMPINFHPYRTAELQPGLTAIKYLKSRLDQMGYGGSLLTEIDH